jgi:FixJ family two-component response regulator
MMNLFASCSEASRAPLGFSTDTFASVEDYLYSANRQYTIRLILDVRFPGMGGIGLQAAA